MSLDSWVQACLKSAGPKSQKLAEMKFQIFSHKTWSDKLGEIWGEDLRVILYSK